MKFGDRFSQGFVEFLKSGEFSDVTISFRGKIYKSHKILLGHKSEFFRYLLPRKVSVDLISSYRKLFTSQFKESTESFIELHFEDPKDIFSDGLYQNTNKLLLSFLL
jgi:hypothetical protein